MLFGVSGLLLSLPYRTSQLQLRTPLLIKNNITPRCKKRIDLGAAVDFFAEFLRFVLNCLTYIHCAGKLLVLLVTANFINAQLQFRSMVL